MNILVTGGAGYIGSHTCVELLQAGYSVIVLDNLSNSKYEAIARVEKITGQSLTFYEGDLLDEALLQSIFSEQSIDAVIHFAGSKAVGESVEKPLAYYQNNVASTVLLCQVMARFNVFKLVFSSSATVYGHQEVMPITEEASLQATNPYGRTKLMIEEIFRDVGNAEKRWSVALLRYFNPVGAHESGMIGEDPNGIPNNLVPYISQVAIGKLQQLKVFGGDYATKDGTGVRDYIHVTDLARGHLKALSYIRDHEGVEAFNLGAGVGYSVLEMVQAFERAADTSLAYEIVPRRAGDIEVCYADVQKAKQHLDWQAVHTLDDMCRDTWKWQSQNPNGYEEKPKQNKAFQTQ
ncbi:UDP-glucose 4-epimerase [Fictibacillus macauensis ZFHKF-1]|uniref:UDP-glucose 4-epimerase n=1 Tax=Fictibacillus macauensis ZFHKF-1 TaxID=1196324 RepID=I8UI31_9BACL|nr:UDP-glucose 4-epimerase GalE [Fictibacillus macauensis]EIT86545.1 UDP-glucose 4-epimerase [Fictibacillus macauensis ZFHKF-1]